MIQIKCACLAMWLLWCTAAAAHGMLWSRVPGAALHSTSSGTSGDRDVVFEVLPTEVCRYDELSIKMSHAPNASSDVLICVQREHSDFLYVHRVPTASPAATKAYGQDTQSAAIRCVLNEDDCIPKTDSLAVKNIPGGAFPYSLVVRFSQETNRPPLSSTYDVLNALDFQPHLTGLMAAEWVDAKTLHVFIDKDAYDVVMAAHRNAATISVSTRVIATNFSSTEGLSLRASETGRLFVFALNSSSRTLISDVHSVVVTTCDRFLAVGDKSDFADSSEDSAHVKRDTAEIIEFPPQPLFRLAGVAAIAGMHPVVVPHVTAPVMESGNWSMSFWIYLIDPPKKYSGKPSAHRTLFYKGDSTVSSGRTPSVWLLPDTNRMTIRVSTVKESDVAVESFIDIPSFKWTLVTFVFSNATGSRDNGKSCSASDSISAEIVKAAANGIFLSTEAENLVSGSQSGPLNCSEIDETVEGRTWFNIKAYVNSTLDISADFKYKVVGNNASLRLFCDPSHSGPRGFAADIIVWDGLLSNSHVASLVKDGPPAAAEGVGLAVHLLRASSTSSAVDASLYSSYPSVLERLLYPTTELVDNDKIILKSPLSLNLEGEKIIGTEEVEIATSGEQKMAHSTPTTAHFSVPEGSDVIDKVLAEALHAEAIAAYQACEDTYIRLDKYAQAVIGGKGSKTYGENLFKWAMVKAFGVEAPDTKCGVSASRSSLLFGGSEDSSTGLNEQVQGFRALLKSAASGYANALPVLVTFFTTGSSAIPVFIDHFSNLTVSDTDFSPLDVETARSLKEYMTVCETSRLQKMHGDHIYHDGSANRLLRPADSAFCFQHSSGGTSSKRRKDVADPILKFSIGLLYVAAAVGGSTDAGTSIPEAFVALSHRYQYGIGVDKDTETAGFYATISALSSSNAYHAVGGMPVVETDRIDENTEKTVELGNMGNDDEAIQLARVRAEEGDLNAMVNMGDLHYFGARGLPRDQPRALDYYNRAAVARHTQGMCCAAAMYLKGEGMDAANGTRAVELYTQAAQLGSVKALNGLGYIYFHGTGGMEVNQTKAFECFLNATYKDEDADSWYNAGYCLQYGKGTPVDLGRAASFYKKAITKYGHFGSAFLLGNMHYQGHGVVRSVPDALYYLNSINALGPWAGWVRRGLDAYLERNTNHASLCYLHAGEIGGFEVAHSNAAFLLRRTTRVPRPSFAEVLWEGVHDVLYLRLMSYAGLTSGQNNSHPNVSFALNNSDSNASMGVVSTLPARVPSPGLYHPTAMLRQLLLAVRSGNSDVMRNIGDAFYYDMFLPFDSIPGNNRSVMWYQRASARGSALSSLALGYMHQFGVGTTLKNTERAEKYYADSLQRSDTDAVNSAPMQLLARSMVWWLRLCRRNPWLAPVNSLIEELVAKFDFFGSNSI